LKSAIWQMSFFRSDMFVPLNKHLVEMSPDSPRAFFCVARARFRDERDETIRYRPFNMGNGNGNKLVRAYK
jgi:hypothetical protein